MLEENKKLKVFTAFSGYDSQCLALNRLKEKFPGFDYELVGWSEIDPNAIKAHNVLFPEAENRNLGDISKIDWTTVEDFDLFTYSSPCLPFSELVLTPEGYRPIGSIRPGDEVMTRSGFRKVAKKFQNGLHSTCYMRSMGFRSVKCTYNHRFWVRQKETDPAFIEVKDLIKGKHYLAMPVNQEEIGWLSDSNGFWFMAGCILSGTGTLTRGGDIGYLFTVRTSERSDAEIRCILGNPESGQADEKTGSYYSYDISEDDYNMLDDFFVDGTLSYDIVRLPKELLGYFVQGFVTGSDFDASSNTYSSAELSSLRSFYIMAHVILKSECIVPEITECDDFYRIEWSYNGTIEEYASFMKDGYMWVPFLGLEDAGIEEVYNIEMEDDHSYVVDGLISANCTDFSLAGKQMGGEKGSGTRSSLLWECERTIREKRPKYLLLENVTALCQGKFLNLFERWISTVNSYGYVSFWQTLNAKHYGVPHNRDRVFLVSIRKDSDDEIINYNFPNRIPLERTIESVLEPRGIVDEKYYIDQEKVDQWAIENEKRIVECIIERNKINSGTVQLENEEIKSDMEDKKEKKEKKARKPRKKKDDVVAVSLIDEPIKKTVVEATDECCEDECCETGDGNADYESDSAWNPNIGTQTQTKESKKKAKPIIEYLTDEDKKLREGTMLVKRIPTPTCSDGSAPTLMATGYANAGYKNFYSVGHFPKLGVFEIWRYVSKEDENVNTLL